MRRSLYCTMQHKLERAHFSPWSLCSYRVNWQSCSGQLQCLYCIAEVTVSIVCNACERVGWQAEASLRADLLQGLVDVGFCEGIETDVPGSSSMDGCKQILQAPCNQERPSHCKALCQPLLVTAPQQGAEAQPESHVMAAHDAHACVQQFWYLESRR